MGSGAEGTDDLRRVGRGEDRTEHRHAQRATELPGGVVDAGGGAPLVVGHRAHDRLGRRRRDRRQPEGQQHHGEDDRPQVGGVLRRVEGRHDEAGSHQQQPRRHDQPRADLERHHGGDRREDRRHDREGQRVHAGRQRRVALHELEVLGDQEDEAEEAEERHRDGERTAGEAGDLEDPHVEQRPLGAQLEQRERRQQDGGGGEAGQRRPATPSPTAAPR